MGLSSASFAAKKRASAHGNVHLKVEDYIRNERNMAVAAHGFDLKTGEEMAIRLADPERFARLYLNPREDLARRVAHAEKTVSGRTGLHEVGAARGNKAVPVGGVVTFQNVRQDLSDGQLYARWSNAVVTDPEGEIPLMGSFEIHKTQNKTADGKPFDSAYLQAYFTPSAKSGAEVSRADLDQMLSGKLLDTEADLRTNVLVTVELDGVTESYAFRPRQVKVDERVFRTPRGVEEALNSTPVNKPMAAAAATAVAAKAGLPIDAVKIAPNSPVDNDTMRSHLQQLYDGVKDGTIPATFTPGASMQASRFLVDAIYGRKTTVSGEVVNAKTAEQDLADRGFVDGVMGVRFVAASTGTVVNPTVKAVYSNEAKLPSIESDYFVHKSLNAVGRESFLATQPEDTPVPRISFSQPDTRVPQNEVDNDYGMGEDIPQDYEDDDDLAYADSGPSF